MDSKVVYFKLEGLQEFGVSCEGCRDLAEILLNSMKYIHPPVSVLRLKVSGKDGEILLTTTEANLPENSVGNPFLLSVAPAAPAPPAPVSPPVSLGTQYVERECAKLSAVLEKMERGVVALLGPKGAGKSRTLLEAFHCAQREGENAIYIDAKWCKDPNYENCYGVGLYFFVDNAQVMRRDNMKNLGGMLKQGKVILAFSSSLLKGDGYSTFNCPVMPEIKLYLVPFTNGEVQKFISTNCTPGTSYSGQTTLPGIVKTVLVFKSTYSAALYDLLQHFLVKMVDALWQQCRESVAVLKLLYSFLHVGESLGDQDLRILLNCGLVFEKGSGGFELVYERKFVFNILCETARNNHALFSTYDLGGAEELLFSDCCQRGVIEAVCLGACYTVRGRSSRHSKLHIECSTFREQPFIGAPVTVPNGPTCCLIKLARNHPAIDFIIYKTAGGKGSRVLYFIQVSASTYQNREKRFGSVCDSFDGLSGKTPHVFYKNMFGLSSNEVYYIYSTTAPIPSPSTTIGRREKDRVYFHQLMC